jgi:hypothetical protein
MNQQAQQQEYLNFINSLRSQATIFAYSTAPQKLHALYQDD